MESVGKKGTKREEIEDGELEEEVEQFFEIIRRFREARAAADRIRVRPRPDLEEEEDEKERRKKRMRAAAAGTKGAGWVPKFEREDFNTQVEFVAATHNSARNSSPLDGGSGSVKKEEAGEDDSKLKSSDDRLDLKLTL
ncbi:hypothetical protein CDL15_Pgr010005 [Punica granatum]|uniref:Uncharacterized protein n=1 Tax=Punica granatum TaxID=22663 RepID=A0A218X4Z8_PUNGR|nr:hypothetical protein CDL15_Pgr010005 [Punica granatum]PKI38836.1 hypothetical protein CRG98_040774 [Punica granatum]